MPEAVREDLPEVVYHYTTMETLLKIVEGASIWATSANYLNDKMEGEHFLQIVRARIPEYRKDKKFEDGSIFDEFLKDATRPFQWLPFVASFTSESDSLSQWRSYCPNGNGVSIGFRVDCLKRAFVKVNGQIEDSGLLEPGFVAVEYYNTTDNLACDAEIDLLVLAAKHLFERASKREPSGTFTLADYVGFLLQRRAFLIKHPSFSNEKEYRLVIYGCPGNLECLQFRPTRSSLVPYVPLSIPRKHSEYVKRPESAYGALFDMLGSRWDFIDNVVVGPTPNEMLSVEAVRGVFAKHQMAVKVIKSQVPYRDW